MSLFSKKAPLERNEVFAALDIGSSKVCCAIAKVQTEIVEGEAPTHKLRVLGVGYQVSRGLKGGNIVDMEALEDSILNAVHSAEQAAGKNINSVYVSVPAGATQSRILRSEVYLSGAPVDENHLKRLLNITRDDSIGANRYIMHILPISYDLDSISGIRDPRGMIGEKLSVNLHIISAPSNLIRNLSTCIGRCHLDVEGFVVSSYASGLATLVEDELELGVTVVDLGGGNTTLASFQEGNLVRVQGIPVGGAHITNDIARGLATPLAQAERLKTLYGTLIPSSSDDRESILVPQMGELDTAHGNQISKSMLTHIIRSRMEEIFELVAKSIKTSKLDPLVYQRIVITGGSSHLQGVREMANQILGRQVRMGYPTGLYGSSDMATNPIFSTCAGLLQYALQDYTSKQVAKLNKGKSNFFQKINYWIKENF